MKRQLILLLIISPLCTSLVLGQREYKQSKFSIGVNFGIREYHPAGTHSLWVLVNQEPPSEYPRSGSLSLPRHPFDFSVQLSYHLTSSFSLSFDPGFIHTAGSGNFFCYNNEYTLRWKVFATLISLGSRFMVSFLGDGDRFRTYFVSGVDYYWGKISLRTSPFIDIETMNMSASGSGLGYHIGVEAEYFPLSKLALYYYSSYLDTGVIHELKRNGHVLKNSDFYVPTYYPFSDDNFTLDFSKRIMSLGLRWYF